MEGAGSETTATPTEPVLQALQNQGRVLAEHARLLREASAAMQSNNQRLQSQEARHEEQTVQMQNLTTMIQALSTQVAMLTTPPGQPSPSPASLPAPSQPNASIQTPPTAIAREPHLASPKPFDGNFSQFRGFIMQCELIFHHQPSQYYSPAARVAFVTSLTTGDALNWAEATLCARPALYDDYSAFVAEFRRVFDHPTAGQDVGARLMTLHQGNKTVAAYSTEFRTLAAGSGWNDAGLRSAFRQGLSEGIKDELVRDKPSTLDDLISLAIEVDERIRERKRERSRNHPNPTPARSASTTPSLHPSPSATQESTSSEEPMQLGRARLTAAEKEFRRAKGLCMYCGQKGHIRNDCPLLPKD